MKIHVYESHHEKRYLQGTSEQKKSRSLSEVEKSSMGLIFYSIQRFCKQILKALIRLPMHSLSLLSVYTTKAHFLHKIYLKVTAIQNNMVVLTERYPGKFWLTSTDPRINSKNTLTDTYKGRITGAQLKNYIPKPLHDVSYECRQLEDRGGLHLECINKINILTYHIKYFSTIRR